MRSAESKEYRPDKWSEVIGQDKALARIDALRRRGQLVERIG